LGESVLFGGRVDYILSTTWFVDEDVVGFLVAGSSSSSSNFASLIKLPTSLL
jgi:triosephosphate isomerase